MLTDVMRISTGEAVKLYRFAIRTGGNVLLFGGTGTGKTEMGQQAIELEGFQTLYLNLSLLEPPDLVGIPNQHPDGYTDYSPPRFMPLTRLQPRDADGRIIAPKYVILMDEVDKTKPDIQAPVLEILKDRTLNGEPLHVQACLLTGNLPDEGAFSLPVSHAITNRCKVYRVDPHLEAWLEHARTMGCHPLILHYLERSPNRLAMPPKAEDPTAYAHPTPRAWMAVSKDLWASTKDPLEFQVNLVAGHVGCETAADFQIWLTHYRELDPKVDALLQYGQRPEAMELDRTLLFATSAVNKVVAFGQRENVERKELLRVARHAFDWLETIQPEYQFAVIKNGNVSSLHKHDVISDVPSLMRCIDRVFKITNR